MRPPPPRKRAFLKLAHLLLDRAALFRRAVDEALLARCAVSLPEKEVLARLVHAKGRLRMSEVSKALMFTDGGATKLIGRLVDKGLVLRRRSEEDQRVVLVQITAEGEAKLSGALAVMTEVVEPMLTAALSADERATLAGLLDELGSTPD